MRTEVIAECFCVLIADHAFASQFGLVTDSRFSSISPNVSTWPGKGVKVDSVRIVLSCSIASICDFASGTIHIYRIQAQPLFRLVPDEERAPACSKCSLIQWGLFLSNKHPSPFTGIVVRANLHRHAYLPVCFSVLVSGITLSTKY